MAIKSRSILKSYLEREDKPTEQQFANLIDSLYHKDDTVTTGTTGTIEPADISNDEYTLSGNNEPPSITLINESTTEELVKKEDYKMKYNSTTNTVVLTFLRTIDFIIKYKLQ